MANASAETSYRAPGPIAPTATSHFASGDGTQLYYEWFPVDRPRALALIVHGYLEHCGRYHELANVLNRAGFATLSYDMRGHGRADGQRSYIDSVDNYLDDLDAALAQLRARASAAGADQLPVLLVGHSNGGMLVLRTLADPERKPHDVNAVVVSSPFLGFKVKLPSSKKFMAKTASRWFPRLSLPSDLKLEWLTTDPDKLAERRVDTLCNEVASARWYTATISAQEYIADYAGRIDVPSLWLVGANDQIADPEIAKLVHARLRAPSEYRDLTGMQHEVFNERERARVFGYLESFAQAHFNDR